MSNDINLLHTKRARVSPVVERRVRVFRTISVTFLFLVAVLSCSLFIISNLSSLPRLREEEQKLLADFSNEPLRGKADSYFLTKVRAEDITKVIEKRERIMRHYNFMRELASPSVVLTSINANQANNSFSVVSNSLPEIENVIEKIKKLPLIDKSVGEIKMSDISYNKEQGYYVVKIDIAVVEKLDGSPS